MVSLSTEGWLDLLAYIATTAKKSSQKGLCQGNLEATNDFKKGPKSSQLTTTVNYAKHTSLESCSQTWGRP